MGSPCPARWEPEGRVPLGERLLGVGTNALPHCPPLSGAESAGRAGTVTSASGTQAVSTAPASSLGSAPVRKAGGASSATRVSLLSPLGLLGSGFSQGRCGLPESNPGLPASSCPHPSQTSTTAHTTSPVRTGPPAPTRARAATPARAGRGTRGPLARPRLTSVAPAPAGMGAAAR